MIKLMAMNIPAVLAGRSPAAILERHFRDHGIAFSGKCLGKRLLNSTEASRYLFFASRLKPKTKYPTLCLQAETKYSVQSSPVSLMSNAKDQLNVSDRLIVAFKMS